MGRFLLLTLLLAACAPSGTRVVSDGGHGDLACVTCHQGGRADVGLAMVPEATCGTAGCHSDLGPRRIETETFAFEHRAHGSDSVVVEAGCAGCHTHGPEAGPLTAGVDACALCHADALDGDKAQDCRLCHEHPDHFVSTSQAVSFAHEGLPWIERSCVRCHYDVSRPEDDVPPNRCQACHIDVDDVVAASIDEDLHPDHQGTACVSCHTAEVHQIGGMSTAVELNCWDCHRAPHDVLATGAGIATVDCNSCHGDTHADQQRLLLGVMLPADLAGSPSEKYMAGLTCRSCHVASANADPSVAVSGSRVSCTGCHRSEYSTVLAWWREGTNQRVGVARRYLRNAQTALGNPPAAVQASLSDAEDILNLVASAGGQHNLLLSHTMLEESLQRSARAYQEAGRTAPALPDLGTRPRMGICSYCHYRRNDPWTFGTMPRDFHEAVMAPRAPIPPG